MKLKVSNIRFITDEPKRGQDRLLAVFALHIELGSGYHGLTIEGFRFYQPPGAPGYVTVPSIKTKNATVRPVAITPDLKTAILETFLEAWGDLPRPESVKP